MSFTPGWRARNALVLALAVLAAVAGCGKKGPPREPLVRLPGPIADFAARRIGSTVYLKFTVPAKNQDNSVPADVKRVEVYGFTGTPADNDEIVKYGTLVASVPVRKPAEPEEEDRKPGKTGDDQQQKKANAGALEPGFDQGAVVTITDALTDAANQPVVVKRRQKRGSKVAPERPPVLLPLPSFSELPARIYVAVGVNHKNRRGTFSARAAVPLVDLPSAPSDLTITYTETTISLTWTPPAGAPLPPVAMVPDPDVTNLTAKPIWTVATPVWAYDVFDRTPMKPAEEGAAAPPIPGPPRPDVPVPLNAQPLATATFTDPRPIVFGAQRCYAVRTVNTFGTMVEESAPSQVGCVTPKDTFPPAAPKGLIAVATAGSISLNWEPNTEADLAGYLVLRGEAPGVTLTPITPEPIKETTYEDKSVSSGVRYVYVVVAVDTATPRNVSAQSNRIEETAR